LNFHIVQVYLNKMFFKHNFTNKIYLLVIKRNLTHVS